MDLERLIIIKTFHPHCVYYIVWYSLALLDVNITIISMMPSKVFGNKNEVELPKS